MSQSYIFVEKHGTKVSALPGIEIYSGSRNKNGAGKVAVGAHPGSEMIHTMVYSGVQAKLQYAQVVRGSDLLCPLLPF